MHGPSSARAGAEHLGTVRRPCAGRADRRHRVGEVDRVGPAGRRGAVIVDADAIVRELQQPGKPVFDAMVERFGPGIVAADGAPRPPGGGRHRVHRRGGARSDLNAIVHPAVGAEIVRRLAGAGRHRRRGRPRRARCWSRAAGTGVGRRSSWSTSTREVAVARLVAHRGMRRGRRPGPHGPPGLPGGAAGHGRPRRSTTAATSRTSSGQVERAWAWLEAPAAEPAGWPPTGVGCPPHAR